VREKPPRGAVDEKFSVGWLCTRVQGLGTSIHRPIYQTTMGPNVLSPLLTAQTNGP
jgi:hypothetical protein